MLPRLTASFVLALVVLAGTSGPAAAAPDQTVSVIVRELAGSGRGPSAPSPRDVAISGGAPTAGFRPKPS